MIQIKLIYQDNIMILNQHTLIMILSEQSIPTHYILPNYYFIIMYIKSLIIPILITVCLSLCPVATYYNATLAKCELCVTACTNCTNSTSCNTCVSATYYNSTNNSCLACAANCISCNATNCITCGTGQSPSLADNTCVNCAPGCLACVNSTYCSTCQTGYYPSQGVCNTTCIDNCQQCTNGLNCTLCVSGYYFNSTQAICAVCSIQCSLCLNSTYCLTCNSGFSSNNGLCQACPSSCPATCLFTATGALYCSSCPVGYLNGTTCIPCVTGCLLCNSGGCTQATPGYYISSNGSVSNCPSNCATCNSSLKCTSCIQGQLVLGLCNSCGSYCTTCNTVNGVTTCTQCDSGYYPTGGALCSSCSITGCYLCSSNTCIQCNDAYYMSNGICNSCPTNCASCSMSAGVVSCKSCDSGYTLASSSTVCSPKNPATKKGMDTMTLIFIILFSVVTALLIAGVSWYCLKRRKQSALNQPLDSSRQAQLSNI